MDEEALQWTRGEVWARAFPDAPPGELERFRVANIDKPLEAKRIYDWYRGWRRAEGSAARVAASAARVPNFHFVTVGGRTPLGDKILLVEGARFDPSVDPAAYVALICLRMGSKRVIQRRFNVSVSRARVLEKVSTLRDRSER